MGTVESRTIRFHQHGEPLEVLRAERTEIPDPPPGAVRIRVAATGLNPADWELCRGFMAGSLPRGIGVDVAGTIDAVGDGVGEVHPGDLVFGMTDFAGQPSAGAADVAILTTWAHVPEGLDALGAAVLPMVVETAAWTLDALGVGPGATVVIHGGGSMVGYGAVQVARDLGARVIATAGATYTADLQGFGARVTTYGEGMVGRVLALAGGPVDVVLDTAPPSPGTIARLIEIAGSPERVVTISNHDEARSQGARVNLDLLSPEEQTHRQSCWPTTPHAPRAAPSDSRSPGRSPSTTGGMPSRSACRAGRAGRSCSCHRTVAPAPADFLRAWQRPP